MAIDGVGGIQDVILDQDSLNPRLTVGNVFLPSYSTTEAQPSLPIHVFAIEQEMVNRLRNELCALEQHSSGSKRQRERDVGADAMKVPKLDEEGSDEALPFPPSELSQLQELLQNLPWVKPRPKAMPDDAVKCLDKYVKVAVKAMGYWPTAGNKTTEYHLIAPVLIHVCAQLGDDARLLVDEEELAEEGYVNEYVKFMIVRGDKKVCVVLSNDAEQLVDREGRLLEYVIATDFIEWRFYHYRGSKIEKSYYSLAAFNGIPTYACLKVLCAILYGFC